MVTINQAVKIVAGGNASQRTRNRLREHGNVFKIEAPQQFCQALNCEAICVSVETSTDRWVGWLPVDEILVNTL
jgi:hypothetical protein